jgi:5-methylcytosine-specific restriction endonuclease McrA
LQPLGYGGSLPIGEQDKRAPSCEVFRMWHAKVAGLRSSDDGDWVCWSTRRGRYPTVSLRPTSLLRRQDGRSADGRLFFQHDDQLEVDYISGNRWDSRYSHLQTLHGNGHDAKTREDGLLVGRRDKQQNTDERSAWKRAR